VAETSINHRGSARIAKSMVKIAADAGTDAVKTQHHICSDEMINHPIVCDLIDLIPRYSLKKEELKELKKYADEFGIVFLCTAFSLQAAIDISDIVSAYKIGSCDIPNIPLLRRIADFKKSIILSTGMSTLSEVEAAVTAIEKSGCDLALLVCSSKYPADGENIDLTRIEMLKSKFNCPVGFSDHTNSIYIPLAPAATAARGMLIAQ